MKSFKRFLLEYYTTPLSEIVKYLKMYNRPDEERWLYLGQEYYGYKNEHINNRDYLFFQYWSDWGGSVDIENYLDDEERAEYLELKKLAEEDGDKEKEKYEFEDSKINEWVDGTDEGDSSEVPEQLMIDFGKWVEDHALSFEDVYNWGRPKKDYISLSNYPPHYFMSYEGFVKNDWLVHFSEFYEKIAYEGFLFGVRRGDMKGLALSTWKSLDDKELINMDGYVFCYPLNQFYTNLFGRGTGFVIFQGSGIKVYHKGDNEFQVITMKDSAKNFIPVHWNDNEDRYEIRDKESEKVYWVGKEDSFEDMMENLNDWIENNIRQYGKRIITKV